MVLMCLMSDRGHTPRLDGLALCYVAITNIDMVG